MKQVKQVFFIKIRTQKEVKEVIKNVTELVMLEAMSLSDIDAQVAKYAEQNPQFRGLGQVDIIGVTFTKVKGIFEIVKEKEHLSETQWYKVSASYMEEISEGKMMKRTDIFMIESDSVRNAESEITEHLKTYMEDYSIAGVDSSKVVLYMNQEKPMKIKANLIANSADGDGDDTEESLFDSSEE